MFVIPDNLGQYSVAGLKDLAGIARHELNELKTTVTNPEDVTDEQLTRMEDLHEFTLKVDEEIIAREEKVSRFTKITTPATSPESEEVEDAGEESTPEAPEQFTKTEVLEGEVVPAPKKVPSLSEVAPHAPEPQLPVKAKTLEYHSFVVAADIEDYATGAKLESWDDIAKAFSARTRAYGGNTPLQHAVARIRRDFPEELIVDDTWTDETQQKVLQYAADEKRLEGNSLLAAAGWCAPSETLYDTCLQVSSDGMWDGPEVVARRGGIRHNQGIDFSTLFGDDFTLPIPGYNILTEAQVIAGSPTKTCVAIPCPTFTDERLNVAALCLTGSLLQNRGYPEFVSQFVQGSIVAFGHLVNREVVAAIVTGSTAVTLAASDPWASDNTVVSQVLHSLDHAATDMKYRLRLARNATLEVVLPYWLQHMFRADWSRRTGVNDPNATDAMITAWFATRGIRAQWIYDWQDFFSGVTGANGGFGASTAVIALPATLQFLMYPAGTWVLARQDVIRLDSVYDAANLANNLVTQLFMEDGWLPMRMCPLSRVYTVPICPSGATTATRAVDCVVP
jgi:hypothetical protein